VRGSFESNTIVTMTALPSPPTVWFNPPLSAGPVTVQNGHLAVGQQRATFFGVNFDATAIFSLLNVKEVAGVRQQVLDPSQQTVMAAQLDNLLAGGVRAVRVHGLDCASMANIFATGSTTTFNPAAVEALDWFLAALEQRELRFVLELHYTRQLVPGDLPANASALAQECVQQSCVGAPVGTMVPWVAFDTVTLQPLMNQYSQMLLRHVNQFTGTAIGDSPACLAVQLTNEQSLTKVSAWSMPTNCPVLQQAFVAATTNWCETVADIPLAKMGAVEHAEFWAWQETQWMQNLAAVVRTFTHALVIAESYFGDGPYSMLVSSLAVADILDAHFYSYYSPSDQTANGGPGNGFLCGFSGGQTASSVSGTGASSTSARSRFEAVLAGCNLAAAGAGSKAVPLSRALPLPLFVTEWGPVAQYRVNGQFEQDPVAERSQVLAAVVDAAIAQDVDAIFLYSWAHSPVFSEGSIYWKPDCYDFRVDPVLVSGFAAQAARFHDLSLRGSASSQASVTVTATNGLYGAMVTDAAGKQVYEQYGPYTDPALYAIPAGTKAEVMA
jgi:hypothetical protein